MEALEIFKNRLKQSFVPTVPTEKKQAGTIHPANTNAVPSVPAVPTKKNDTENKIKVYNYKIKDKPDFLLRVIMPNCDLQKAKHILKNKYGDRLLMVVEYKGMGDKGGRGKQI